MNESSERELWIQYKERKDDSAREQLIIHHVRVVRYVAGRMAIHVPSSIDMDDLLGWGMLGLLDAVDKFDHSQSVKFTTYASIRVRGAIIDQIRSLDWAPRSLRAMARKIGAAREKLRHEKGGDPSAEAIAEVLGTTEEAVEDTMSQLQAAQTLSLDAYIYSDDDSEPRKMDSVKDAATPSAEQKMEHQERLERLAEAILQLPDQQQKVLNLYYYEELTLKEIGAVLNVSESRICQVHSAAMKELRKALQQQGGV